MDDHRKNYRLWDAEQNGHGAVSPREALPEDDLVFFLIDLVPQIDLTPFHHHYARELRGQPPFDVTMMVTLLVYAYSVGVCSSRKIVAACERNLAFRAIVGNDPPDFRTISDFRKIHSAAFRPLFLEVLRLAGELGMVKLGNLSTDGTKMRANASRHKAMSYGYMSKEINRLEAEIDQLLKHAEELDAEQDAALGSRRGDELPDELKRREQRLVKIKEAKARLEAKALAKAEEEQRRRDEEQAKREAEGRQRRGKEPAPVDSNPEEKAQTNFTDPEAKIMKQSNKGFDYSYNAQAVVDSTEQMIVAAEVTSEANDKQQAVPMAQAALDNLNAAGIKRPMGADGKPAPIPNTADSGYFSEKAVEGTAKIGMDPHFAVGRQKHHEAPIPPPATVPSAQAVAKEKMQEKLRSATGKALYAARKHIVEPVFGQIKSARGVRKFLLRGLEKVSAEWQLICLTHNLLKIWRRSTVPVRVEGIVRASAGSRPKGRGPAKTEGQCRNIREFSDTLLAALSSLASLDPPRKAAVALRLLKGFSVEAYISADDIVAAGERFREWVGTKYPGAAWITEVPVSAPRIAGGQWSGTIDLLLVLPDSSAVIVDHKASPIRREHCAAKAEIYSGQLQAYQEILRAQSLNADTAWIHFSLAGAMAAVGPSVQRAAETHFWHNLYLQLFLCRMALHIVMHTIDSIDER